MTTGTYFQVASALGVGIEYIVEVDMNAPFAHPRYRVRVTGGGPVGPEHMTYVEAMDLVRDEIVVDLERNGIDARSSGRIS